MTVQPSVVDSQVRPRARRPRGLLRPHRGITSPARETHRSRVLRAGARGVRHLAPRKREDDAGREDRRPPPAQHAGRHGDHRRRERGASPHLLRAHEGVRATPRTGGPPRRPAPGATARGRRRPPARRPLGRAARPRALLHAVRGRRGVGLAGGRRAARGYADGPHQAARLEVPRNLDRRGAARHAARPDARARSHKRT